MNFQNLRIGHRLAVSFAAVLVLLVAIVGIATWQLRQNAATLALQDGLDERAAMARDWSTRTQLNVTRAIAVVKAGPHPEVEAHFGPLIKSTSAEINTLQKTLEERLTDDAGRAAMATVASRRKAYVDLRGKALELAKKAPAKEIEALLTGQMLPASEAYLDAVRAVADGETEHARQEGQKVLASMRNAEHALLVLLAIALVAGVGLGWLTTRSITAPLGEAVDAAEVIAGGDLSRQVDSAHRSEIGDLLRAIGRMQASLRSLVAQVHSSTDSIRTASGEIAVGNQDLSTRTEQTAANLQLAAASIEQLTGTVRQSAESAREANALAGSAAEVAARGGTVVSQVVATMDDITHSSQKIADITGVIDGIAFQTNILALNAAVEAARAGEQGRGFAVVAGEVRALAQRSAAAAREIKTLIGASVEKVSGGSRLVADAGRTMTEIVDSVQRVSHIIGEITAAAHEQSQGIGEVNGSVSQLDQMTQQNAALVEQSAAAAESLKGQAATLAELIATFRLGDAPRRAATAPRAAHA